MHKHSFVSAALVFAAILALIGCGNALHDLHEKDGVQHPAVTFDKATGTLVQCGSFKFEAKTSGLYGSRAEDVTWDDLKVVSGSAPGAKFNTDTGELSLQLSDTPGAVLAVTARSVRRPEVTSTVEVTVEPFFILQGVDDGEAVTVYFTDGEPMTGTTMNEGVAFVEEDLPGGEWVIEKIEIGATTVLIGRPSGSVGEHGVSLAFASGGGGGSYTLEHRPADGEGYIPIGSYAEFQLIRTRLGASNASDKYKQEAELDLLGDKDGDGIFGETDDFEEWTAIGVAAIGSQFFGTFDGDNKGVRNLYIDKTVQYQGLFGVVGTSGAISNVHIRSGTVTGVSYVGGVVGYSVGPVTNCSNSATVSGNENIGGVAGYSQGPATNCSNSGTVSGNGIVGGVAGYLQRSSTSMIGMTGCSNSGEVSGVGASVGGVVAICTGTIANCFNSGKVMGNGNYIAGVAGQANGTTIENCSNSGSITGSRVAYKSIGGVVGYYNSTGSITNCSNSGTVLGYEIIGGVVGDNKGSVTGCSNSGTVSGSIRSGGVAGQTAGTIENCSNSGTITGGESTGGVVGRNFSQLITGCSNSGMISGNTNTGGVAGQSSGSITASYNTATVTGTTNVGGITGYSSNIIISCYNSGAVIGTNGNAGGVVGHNIGSTSACYNTGMVTGTNGNAGGVAGINYSDGITFGTVAASYNTGTVTGSANVGGVVGNNDTGTNTGTVTDCYWWTGSASDGVGYVGTSSGTITGLGTFSGTIFTPSGTGWEIVSIGGPWKDGTTNGTKLPKLWFE